MGQFRQHYKIQSKWDNSDNIRQFGLVRRGLFFKRFHFQKCTLNYESFCLTVNLLFSSFLFHRNFPSFRTCFVKSLNSPSKMFVVFKSQLVDIKAAQLSFSPRALAHQFSQLTIRSENVNKSCRNLNFAKLAKMTKRLKCIQFIRINESLGLLWSNNLDFDPEKHRRKTKGKSTCCLV